MFSPHTAVQASGEPDMKLVATFSEHFETFDAELAKMCLATDKIVKAYANGESIEDLSKAWVDTWESVGVHGIVEVKAPSLYPPVWIGFYGIKGVADKKGSAEEMYAVGENTKAALWQGLGGLRALANATSTKPDSATTMDTKIKDKTPTMAESIQTKNPSKPYSPTSKQQ